jgi:phenylalanyl-tRNA synthetase beta subunit
MTNCSSIFLPALLGFASIFTPVSQECPRLSLKAKVRPDVKRGILAAKGRSTITVTLDSEDPVDNLEFQLNLPNGLTAERTVMRLSAMPHMPPRIVKNADEATSIYWLGITFTRSKGGEHRFRVKVQATNVPLRCWRWVLLFT